ncbi:MAG: 4Fe-4S dicluster domain-containing protein [Tepidisphaeraceae bacterium]
MTTRAPVALGLHDWPGKPPAFDPVTVEGLVLVPVPPHTDALELIAPGAPVLCGAPLMRLRPQAAPMPIAPCAGKIEALVDATLLNGQPCKAVRFAPAHERVAPVEAPDCGRGELEALVSEPSDLAHWMDRLSELGVGASRVASPDLLGQLAVGLRRPIDAVICSVLDVDPTLCLQSALAAVRPGDLLAGLNTLSRACGASQALIVIDARAPQDWFTSLRELCEFAGARVITLVNDYPQSDPTLMLYTLRNRRLRSGRLPAEQGVLLLDAAAAVAVGAAAARRESMVSLPLAVRHHAWEESYFVTVPLGATAPQILASLGIQYEHRTHTLRGGDALREMRIGPDAVVGESELILHVSTGLPSMNPDPCIRCGWCFEACPTRVAPAFVLEAAQREDIGAAERAGIGACVECGICSYVCPSRLPLLGGIRSMRRRMSPAPE